MEDPIVELAKGTSVVVKEVYKDLARPVLHPIGEALGTVFEVLPSAVLGIKFWTAKRKAIFNKNLENYNKKLENIPEENRIEVDPEIGTPIIEKLTYTSNEEISGLFINLLSKASDKTTLNEALPSFIYMIERLSPDEARIIKYLEKTEFIPYCDYQAYLKNEEGFIFIKKGLTNLPFEIEFAHPENTAAYISNLISLGILVDKSGFYKTNPDLYECINKNYDLEGINNSMDKNKFNEIKVSKSYYDVTDIGRLFIKACTSKF